MPDLDEIRLKEVTELTDADKKALNESWDKLTSEEQTYYEGVKSKGSEGFKMEFKSEEEFGEYLNKRVDETLEERRKQRDIHDTLAINNGVTTLPGLPD